ncbi:MAG: L,D-transpeptidase family protein [Clostridiales bacterium]|nr:L,D-transpeptidase family protein [Clostridiales bacterium]
MNKNSFCKVFSIFLITVLTVCAFNTGLSVPVMAASGDEAETAEEEIDPRHLQFVGRLYAVVTRQMHADEEEKLELARSLKGGISAAYNVLFRFYFSDEYRKLGQSDEQFVEDLYTGCRGMYADEGGKYYYVSKLEEGYSRYLVFKEFISSNDFVDLCRDYNITVEMPLLLDDEEHPYGMTCIGDDYYDLDEYGDLDWCYAGAAKHVRCINEEFYNCDTPFYIFADIDNCYIMIFRGSVYQWELDKIYPMSCGKPGSSTPRGEFEVTGKLPFFYSHGSLCYYATQWNGPYYFHSVTYNYNGTIQNPTLGAHISAGCIRLDIDVAEWIYDNIPEGTCVKTI